MKKPKKGDIVICSEELHHRYWMVIPKNEYKVCSVGEYGFWIIHQKASGGRLFISFDDEWQIKEPEPTEYMPIISLVLAIVIVLLLIFSSFYFKL